MRNSLKMDVLDELRLFREKGLSNSTFCTPVSYSNLNMNLNLNLKLESETVERIVLFRPGGEGGGGHPARKFVRPTFFSQVGGVGFKNACYTGVQGGICLQSRTETSAKSTIIF